MDEELKRFIGKSVRINTTTAPVPEHLKEYFQEGHLLKVQTVDVSDPIVAEITETVPNSRFRLPGQAHTCEYDATRINFDVVIVDAVENLGLISNIVIG